jgi:hypothetical protein
MSRFESNEFIGFSESPAESEPDLMLRYPTSPIRDKSTEIPYAWLDPHYSNEHFTRSQSEGLDIFLAEGEEIAQDSYGGVVRGAHYNYSDRIYQSTSTEQHGEAAERAKELVGNNQSAAFFEAYLREVFKDPTIELVHMKAGVNRGNGFSYRIFGYRSAHSE